MQQMQVKIESVLLYMLDINAGMVNTYANLFLPELK